MLAAESMGDGADSSASGATQNWPTISLAIGIAVIAAATMTRAMRLSVAPSNAWDWGVLQAFAVFLGLGFSSSLGAALARRVFGFTSDDATIQATVIVAAGSFLAQFVLIVGVLARARRVNPVRESEPFEIRAWRIPRSIQLGVVAIAIAWFPLQAVGSIAASIQSFCAGTMPPAEGHSTFQLLQGSQSFAWTAAMVVVVVFLAPIAEEFTFRGGLQLGLRGLNVSRWTRIFLTSAVFAGIHYSVLVDGAQASGLAMLFSLAVVLGWLMERTGRIAAPIAAHALFNSANLCIFWWS